ncbi:threonine synthase [Balneola sp. MJW-20]|uniref:threonine synthase n=1 Tax=Gracilimonas aurantiaca TaxID=3234185 RepID=UPI0034675731
MNRLIATESRISHLYCSACGKKYAHYTLTDFAHCCNKPLLVEYDLEAKIDRTLLEGRENNMWRYREVLPVLDSDNMVSLGEGMTPMLRADRVSDANGFKDLYVKDEGLNPTGSFKARGLSMAISKAKELGVTECVIPTAGNAGGALSAYCARAGMKATVIMPIITPKIFKEECMFYGAEVMLVDGLIDKCGSLAKEIEEERGAFNISTLKEPYRIEGKKTMGYEIAEQFNWKLPDVILYPTGGGTGIIGIWKAFKEMTRLGWIVDEKMPRMIVVQTESCSPVVNEILGITTDESKFQKSIANGLAVPKAFGIDLIREVVSESGGTALTVSEEEIREGTLEFGRMEGISVCTEGGALWMALKKLVERGEVSKEEKIVLMNTGTGLKYLENLELGLR